MKTKFFLMALLLVSVLSYALTFKWESTCGVTHFTTFPDNWTYSKIARWIEAKNLTKCGTEVKVTLS